MLPLISGELYLPFWLLCEVIWDSVEELSHVRLVSVLTCVSERRITSSPSRRDLLEQVRVREGTVTPLPQEHLVLLNG